VGRLGWERGLGGVEGDRSSSGACGGYSMYAVVRGALAGVRGVVIR
jgi:hypothetical protein